MRTAVALVSSLVLAVASLWVGAAYQNHKDVLSIAAAQKDRVALLGVSACGRFMGSISVARDGTLTADQKMTPEEAAAITKTLPEANAGVVTIPCPQGAGARAPGEVTS